MKVILDSVTLPKLHKSFECLYNTIYILRSALKGGGAEQFIGKAFIKIFNESGYHTMMLLENTSSTWTDNTAMLFERADKGTVVKLVQE